MHGSSCASSKGSCGGGRALDVGMLDRYVERGKEPRDDLGLRDLGDDLHRPSTHRTLEHVDGEHAPHELGHAFVGDLAWQREGITEREERPWLQRTLADDDPDGVRVQLSHMAAI
jgi:hypothetical protein